MKITICDLCKKTMTREEQEYDYGVSFAGVPDDDEPEADEICSVCYDEIKDFVATRVVSETSFVISDFKEECEE